MPAQFFELLTQQGSGHHTGWSVTSGVGHSSSSPAKHVLKEYDRSIRGFAYRISDQSTRLGYPEVTVKKTSLKYQKILVVQAYIPRSCSFSFEVGFTDSGGTRRRLIFSSSLQTFQLKSNPLHSSASLFQSHHPQSLTAEFDKVSVNGIAKCLLLKISTVAKPGS
jgi:hypothetical protein